MPTCSDIHTLIREHITPKGDGNSGLIVPFVITKPIREHITPKGDGNFNIAMRERFEVVPIREHITPKGDGNLSINTDKTKI